MKKVREGYKMTELGEIPEEWEVKSIGDIGKFQGGYAFKSEDYTGEGVKLIRITNVQQCNLDWEDKCFLPKSFEEKFQDYSVKINDVVLAMTRPIISTGIKACKVKKQDVPSLLNQRVGRFILSNGLDSGFLYQYIFTDYFINKVNELSSTTGQPNISSKQIESIMITVPLIREQQKISLILSSVDEQIEITDNLIEKTKELKKGLMQKLLTKGIGHSRFKDTEIGKIPEEWEVRRLGDIAEYINGKAFKPSDWSEEGLPIIRIQNLNGSNEFNYCNKQVEEKYYIENNELLFSWSGSRGTSFGPFIWKGDKAVLNQHIFKVELNEELNKSYCYFALKRITQDIEENAHGSAGLVHITKGELEKFKIPIPKELEQKKIASILSMADEQIEQNKSKKEKLQELKKGLMQKLLTGDIRVKA